MAQGRRAMGGVLAAGRGLLRRSGGQSLAGETALVTGGSRGFGYIVARELAREGCRLVICGRDEESLGRARGRLEGEGAEVLAVRCDVSDRAQVEGLIERARGRFGEVDILVNNAGIIQVGPVETQRLRDYEDAMGVMFWGTVYPTLAVLPGMLGRGRGRIVNITSVGGKVSVPHLLPYNCAKFAAVGFSEGLAAEVAGQGIKVTTIVPGPMRVGSHTSIYVSGKQELEYTWFAVAASLPLLSLSGERAARQVVRAVRRGETEKILSMQANALARFHGLFPGLTVRLLGVADRLLPSAGGAGEATERGEQVQRRMGSRVLHAVTALGRAANRRYQQHGED